jgi:HTH-type transcriptional regulator/antitoxin HigA
MLLLKLRTVTNTLTCWETHCLMIHTEAENDRCTVVLEGLLRKKQRTAEEKRLAELLTLLVEEYEQRYALPRTAGPVDVLRHLMDSNGLRQVDLLDVFGTASIVSEVLKGKRELSKTHIAKLSERFHLSQRCSSDLFGAGDRDRTGDQQLGRLRLYH